MTRIAEWVLLKIGKWLYGRMWSPVPLVIVIPVREDDVPKKAEVFH